jgi:hypothetical protein
MILSFSLTSDIFTTRYGTKSRTRNVVYSYFVVVVVLYLFNFARFGAVTKVMLKVVVFWIRTSCGRVKSYRRFEGSCCLYLQGPHAIL